MSEKLLTKKYQILPTYQVHMEELRIEYIDGISGFCDKCCKHYKMCDKSHNMEVCIKHKDHNDNHISRRRTVWNDGDSN